MVASASDDPKNFGASPSPSIELAPNKFVEDNYENADDLFIDDLVAADRFKIFLVGRGIEVPRDVSVGLSELVSAFNADITRHLQRAGLTHSVLSDNVNVMPPVSDA